MISQDQIRIGIIGLGYVGLPLALEFAKALPVTGFDINAERIDALTRGEDTTAEAQAADFAAAQHLSLTSDARDLAECTVYIVTVPTPVDAHNRPDLGPLLAASDTVGRVIARGDVVIFESTVYPGATEEDCVPVIEAASGLRYNRDFFAGYSPERINPGDRTHRLPDIVKVTSGSTPQAAEFIDALYRRIITAGTHPAPSIAVAEAAKVIENTQRDLNIALVNELSVIFELMGIDTLDVLAAAGTKWNFQPFRPGLVGGHCIGVDPYYLTHKAQALGYHPEMVLAGRRINDRMGAEIVHRMIREMILRDIAIKGARVLVMGLTFKEDCPDLRNTRVIDVIEALRSYGVDVDVCDPLVTPQAAQDALGLEMTQDPVQGVYDGVVLAVPHHDIRAQAAQNVPQLVRPDHVIFDLKGVLPRGENIIRP